MIKIKLAAFCGMIMASAILPNGVLLDIKKPTTKIPAIYSDGNIYFYRNDISDEPYETNCDFSLICYNIKTGYEEELVQTNVRINPKIYNGNIYYYEKYSHNVYAMDEQTHETYEVFSPTELPSDKYIDTGLEFIYLESNGNLKIQREDGMINISSVQDFDVDKRDIYYVTGDFNLNEWQIKKRTLQTTKSNDELVLNLQDVKNLNQYSVDLHRIISIDVVDSKIYLLCTDDFSSNELYVYNQINNTIERVGDRCVYEYQIHNDYIYCREKDEETNQTILAKYNFDRSTFEILAEGIASFSVTDNDLLLYMLMGNDTLYVRGKNVDIEIPNITQWYGSPMLK